jgi:hypothetical protein
MDTRRAEFRRWLDYEGILDVFTKCIFCLLITVFVTLFETDPWPENPIDWAIDFFQATPRGVVEAAVAENNRLKNEIAAAEARIAEIEKQLEDAE